MKLILPLVIMVFLSLSFSGCSLHQVKGEVGGVAVDVKSKDGKNGGNGGNGKFCPPGQAKKGNC